jgi:hypothetical protein
MVSVSKTLCSTSVSLSINPRTSFFLIGFYTLSLICLVLILKFGVLPAVNPPSKTLRGMFVLSCTVAGVVGGAVAIFFWKGARYFIGGWGGFAFALWVQCFRNGGLITPVGPRWIFYIGTANYSMTCDTTDSRSHAQVLVPSASSCAQFQRFTTTFSLPRQPLWGLQPSCWAWTVTQLRA